MNRDEYVRLTDAQVSLIAKYLPRGLSEEELESLKIQLERVGNRAEEVPIPSKAVRRRTVERLVKHLDEFDRLYSSGGPGNPNTEQGSRWIEDELLEVLGERNKHDQFARLERAYQLIGRESQGLQDLKGLQESLRELKVLLERALERIKAE